ncbi:unnamed protein product [Rotaria sordida]|uniref:RRM domain-containing protein n=2 Tax=Rotaria sordida TaxID=392033 RepID=A0A814DQ14_9BILA|nr:unnamed protein product [Rotaria sordida]
MCQRLLFTAESEAEVDEDITAAVRILYARNLMMNTTEEQIKEILECFKPNSVERVTKLKDYAFVHFKERDDASHAMNLMNDRETDDPIAEVTLAKSVDKNQYFRFTRDVSPRTIAANSLFVLPTSAVGPRTTAFDFTSHLTAISYLIIPPTSLTTNPTPISTILASRFGKNKEKNRLNGFDPEEG